MAENINSITETEICYQLDVDDFESENEDEKEFDENEKINQTSPVFYHFNSNKVINNHIAILKQYRILHIEFTTPPPEFV